MALNRDFVGRSYPSGSPYEVSRVKIKEFAAAIGDSNPIYRDREAARSPGTRTWSHRRPSPSCSACRAAAARWPTPTWA